MVGILDLVFLIGKFFPNAFFAIFIGLVDWTEFVSVDFIFLVRALIALLFSGLISGLFGYCKLALGLSNRH